MVNFTYLLSVIIFNKQKFKNIKEAKRWHYQQT